MKAHDTTPQPLTEFQRVVTAALGFGLILVTTRGFAYISDVFFSGAFVCFLAAVFIAWLAMPRFFRYLGMRLSHWVESQTASSATECADCSRQHSENLLNDKHTEEVTK